MMAAARRPNTDPRSPSEVDHLLDVAHQLWPTPARVDLARRRSGRPEARDWLVLPSLGRPWLLLPAARPTVASALLRDDRGQRSPRLVRALAALHRRQLLARLPLARLRVRCVDGADSIEAELARILGASGDLVVRLGRRRWNRSVVLRSLDRTGDTLAYVKSAASEAGTAALRRERDSLHRIAELAPALVEWPDVLHHGTWRGLDLLALSPLVGDRAGGSADAMPTAAMRTLAFAAGRGSRPLAETRLARRWVAEGSGLAASGQRDRLLAAVDAVGCRLGRVELPVGCWHGDWVPWNMASRGDRVLLWDWEHFEEGVPVGLDGLHYRAQQLRMRDGGSRPAEDRWVGEATQWLRAAFRLTDQQVRATVLGYLVEINLRYLRDRAHDPRGIPPRAGWGLAMIDRLVAEWN